MCLENILALVHICMRKLNQELENSLYKTVSTVKSNGLIQYIAIAKLEMGLEIVFYYKKTNFCKCKLL